MKKTNKIAAFLLAFVMITSLGLAEIPEALAEWGVVYYNKIQIHTYPSKTLNANDVPYVDQNVSDFDVRMISDGLAITGWSLTDAYGNTEWNKVKNMTYILTVNVTPIAFNGIFDYSTTAIINGVASNVSLSPDCRTATVSRMITPKAMCPVVWHSPTDETHFTGEVFSFVATASPYFSSYQWYLKSPNNEQILAENAGNVFPGVVATIAPTESGTRCNLNNVPDGMDGWQVWCVFEGAGGAAATNKATIHVKNVTPPTPEPTIQIVPTPVPVPATPEPTPTPEPEIVIVETPEPKIEIVQWETKWTNDEDSHWHKSVDKYSDEIDGKEDHSFDWTVTVEPTRRKPGVKTGVCSVCGYTKEEPAEYVKPEKNPSDDGGLSTGGKIGIGAGILAVLAGGGLFAGYKAEQAKRRRRAKARKKNGYSGKH